MSFPPSEKAPLVTEIEKSSPSRFEVFKPYMPLIIILLMLISLPLVSLAIKVSQDFRSRASESIPAPDRIEISPGEIHLPKINSSPVPLSALAYDKNNQPIWSGVMYNWGISSANSVGTVISHNDLATFYPKNNGRGDLYVTGYTSAGKAQRSIIVTVGPVPSVSPSPISSVPPPTPVSSLQPNPSASSLSNSCIGKPNGTVCTVTVCPVCPPGQKICPKLACKITSGICQKATCVVPTSSITPDR